MFPDDNENDTIVQGESIPNNNIALSSNAKQKTSIEIDTSSDNTKPKDRKENNKKVNPSESYSNKDTNNSAVNNQDSNQIISTVGSSRQQQVMQSNTDFRPSSKTEKPHINRKAIFAAIIGISLVAIVIILVSLGKNNSSKLDNNKKIQSSSTLQSNVPSPATQKTDERQEERQRELYESAVSMMEKRDFQAAISFFTELGNYSDSLELRKECLYLSAQEKLFNEQFEGAKSALKSIPNYKDSNSMLSYSDFMISYYKAKEYIEKDDYQSAYSETKKMQACSETASLLSELINVASFDVKTMEADYKSNEVRATKEYAGRFYLIAGKVFGTNTNFWGDKAYVSVDNGYDRGLLCYGLSESILLSVNRDDEIVLAGYFDGKTGYERAEFISCEMVPNEKLVSTQSIKEILKINLNPGDFLPVKAEDTSAIINKADNLWSEGKYEDAVAIYEALEDNHDMIIQWRIHAFECADYADSVTRAINRECPKYVKTLDRDQFEALDILMIPYSTEYQFVGEYDIKTYTYSAKYYYPDAFDSAYILGFLAGKTLPQLMKEDNLFPDDSLVERTYSLFTEYGFDDVTCKIDFYNYDGEDLITSTKYSKENANLPASSPAPTPTTSPTQTTTSVPIVSPTPATTGNTTEETKERILMNMLYTGDNEQCKMTAAQARAFAELIRNNHANAIRAAIFDGGNGVPMLWIANGDTVEPTGLRSHKEDHLYSYVNQQVVQCPWMTMLVRSDNTLSMVQTTLEYKVYALQNGMIATTPYMQGKFVPNGVSIVNGKEVSSGNMSNINDLLFTHVFPRGTIEISAVDGPDDRLTLVGPWIDGNEMYSLLVKYAEVSEMNTLNGNGMTVNKHFPSPPFLVQTGDLQIYLGPGTNYDTLKTMTTGAGVYTIVEMGQGSGSVNGWGKLKSGAGWINLDDCTLFQ